MSADRLDSAARERMLDLLADRAVQGLSPDEQAELDRLLSLAGGEDESADRAAAAATLAIASILGEAKPEPMPSDLRSKILASGRAAVAQGRTETFHRRPSRASAWSGWIAAAAATLLAIVAWWPKLTEGPATKPNLARQAQRLKESEPDTITVAFKPGPDPDGKTVSGTLVWSHHAQQGYLRFRGLPKNDPSKGQYQLWIFDSKQDERYPIDGGVFDIDTQTGEAIVTIDARLMVVDPKLFAVTIEKPGGVVVSSRERIVALAQM